MRKMWDTIKEVEKPANHTNNVKWQSHPHSIEPDMSHESQHSAISAQFEVSQSSQHQLVHGLASNVYAVISRLTKPVGASLCYRPLDGLSNLGVPIISAMRFAIGITVVRETIAWSNT
jgi:hypothetical protein